MTKYLLQEHLCPAPKAPHRLTHFQRQALIERCDDRFKPLRVELSTRLSFGSPSTRVPRKASENRHCRKVPYCLQGLTTMAGAIGASRVRPLHNRSRKLVATIDAEDLKAATTIKIAPRERGQVAEKPQKGRQDT